MKKRNPGNKMSLIILSLLVLVMISTALTGNLLAKFATGSENREVASVAKFNIIESGVMEIDVSANKLKPGSTLVQPIKVHNDSEVAVDYTLTVNTTGNMPLVLEMNGEQGNPLVFSQTLAPNATERSYDLNIVWPESENDPKYIRMVDVIKLSLTVVQKD